MYVCVCVYIYIYIYTHTYRIGLPQWCSGKESACNSGDVRDAINYNSIKKYFRGTLLPPSDAYVRSFLYLLYTLIKLYYTKALSDPASSLAPD